MNVTKDDFFKLIDYIVNNKFSYLEEISVKSVKKSIDDMKEQLPLEYIKDENEMECFCAAHIFTFNNTEYKKLIIKSLKNMYPKGIINLKVDYEFSNYILDLANNWDLEINYI